MADEAHCLSVCLLCVPCRGRGARIRIHLIEEFLRHEMMHKQEMDDLRYEKIKDERNYLIEQVRRYTLSGWRRF